MTNRPEFYTFIIQNSIFNLSVTVLKFLPHYSQGFFSSRAHSLTFSEFLIKSFIHSGCFYSAIHVRVYSNSFNSNLRYYLAVPSTKSEDLHYPNQGLKSWRLGGLIHFNQQFYPLSSVVLVTKSLKPDVCHHIQLNQINITLCIIHCVIKW